MSISIAAFFSEPSLQTSSPNCLGGGFINPAWNQVRHSRIRERRFLLSVPRYGIRTRNFERATHPSLSRVGITWAEAPDAALSAAATAGMDTWYLGYNRDMAREFVETAAAWARQFNKAAHAMRSRWRMSGATCWPIAPASLPDTKSSRSA